MPGQVGLAYSGTGQRSAVHTLGSLQTGSAWSTIKVALADKVTKDAGGPGALSSTQRSEISRALEASDNDAAMALWSSLVSRYGGASGAAGAVTRVLRGAGDESTVVSSQGRDGFSPYGQTDWSLEAQTRFMASLAGGCLADPGTTSYLLGEMSRVVPGQRWGMGETGAPAQFKGGWGPGLNGGYLVRQMGVLGTGSKSVVLAIAALPTDGQFATGQRMLTDLAGWAGRNLTGQARAAGC